MKKILMKKMSSAFSSSNLKSEMRCSFAGNVKEIVIYFQYISTDFL